MYYLKLSKFDQLQKAVSKFTIFSYSLLSEAATGGVHFYKPWKRHKKPRFLALPRGYGKYMAWNSLNLQNFASNLESRHFNPIYEKHKYELMTHNLRLYRENLPNAAVFAIQTVFKKKYTNCWKTIVIRKQMSYYSWRRESKQI